MKLNMEKLAKDLNSEGHDSKIIWEGDSQVIEAFIDQSLFYIGDDGEVTMEVRGSVSAVFNFNQMSFPESYLLNQDYWVEA